jgi:hypothetical protein
MKIKPLKTLFLAAAIVSALSSCVSIPTAPHLALPPPLPELSEIELDCLSDQSYELVIRYRERVRTLEEIIKSTH